MTGWLRRFATGTAALVLLAACGGSSTPTASAGVATNGGGLSLGASPSGSATPKASGQRTVLTPIGLNVHTQPGVTAARVGSAAQGTVLTVVDHTTASGGWYEVKGSSVTGWISDDAALTTAQPQQPYASATHAFAVLYRQDWTFQDAASGVTFLPQHGTERLLVTGAPALAQLPTPLPGATVGATETVVVCGITTVLRTLTGGIAAAPVASATAGASASAVATPGTAAQRSTLNFSTGTQAFQLTLQYDQPAQLADLRDFYNSMSFTAPQCLSPPPAPA